MCAELAGPLAARPPSVQTLAARGINTCNMSGPRVPAGDAACLPVWSGNACHLHGDVHGHQRDRPCRLEAPAGTFEAQPRGPMSEEAAEIFGKHLVHSNPAMGR
jgi:hypothetical protein